jgi:APA family basic amino acid/polyamine antiporter
MAGQTTGGEKLFVRKATGLVREIGFVTSIIIILANTIGLGWQKRVFQFTGVAPVPNNVVSSYGGIPPMTMAFLIGGVVIALSVLAIAVVSTSMPRSGGGYVVISRLVGPFWGFVGSWMEFLSISWSFGIIAVAVFEGLYFIFGPISGVTAPSYVNDTFLFGAGVLLVILFTAIGAFGVKLTGALLQGMFWIPAVLTFYVFYLLASSNPAGVAAGMTNLNLAAPSQYTSAAIAQGIASAYGSSGGYWGAVATAMIGAYFAYIGYAASTFVAGEIKEANRNLPKILLIATGIIILVYFSVSFVAFDALSKLGIQTDSSGNVWSLAQAWSYLSYGKGSLSAAGLPGLKVWTTTVAGLQGSGIGLGSLNFLLLVFGILWVANDIPPFILTGSRIVFAQSFDRVFPSFFANVNERFHSPVNATILTGIFALLGAVSESGVLCAKAPGEPFDCGSSGSWNTGNNLILGAMLSPGGGVEITDLFDAIFFTLFTLALVFLVLRSSKRPILETTPYKPGGKVGVLVIGAAGFIANLYLDYLLLFAPQGDFALGSFPSLSDKFFGEFALWFTIILVVIGALIYVTYKATSKGVNYSTIFTEIPPE